MLAAVIACPREPRDTWLDIHRRRLRRAWELMRTAWHWQHDSFKPWSQLWLQRRHDWLGHMFRSSGELSEAVTWCDFHWWGHQQALAITGVRHSRRFHPRRANTDVSQWWGQLPCSTTQRQTVYTLAASRSGWRNLRANFVSCHMLDLRMRLEP